MKSLAVVLSRSRPFASAVLAVLGLLVVVALAVDTLPITSRAFAVAFSEVGNLVSALLTALLCLAVAIVYAGRRDGWAWRLLALAFLSSAVAEGIWLFFSQIAGVDVPFPSLADVFYLGFYPLALAGILLLVSPGASGTRRATVILDSLLFTLGLSGLAWQAILAPTIVDAGSLSRLALTLSVAYPIADLLLIFALSSLFLSWELRSVHTSAFLLLGSLVIMVVADLGFAWQSLEGVYSGGSTIDALWIVSYAFAAWAALSKMRSGAATTAGRPAATGSTLNLAGTHLARVLLPYFSLPAAALMIAFHLRQKADGVTAGTVAVIAFSLLLLALVIARQFLTLLENTRLSRSLAVRTAELDMLNTVSAELSHTLVTGQAVTTGLELACEALHAEAGAVWLREGDGLIAAAVRNLPDDVAAALERSARQNVAAPVAINSPMLEVLRDAATSDPQGTGAERWRNHRLVLVPLLSRGMVLGALGLVVTGETVDPARLRIAQSIGAQLGVAVGNAQQYERARDLADRDSMTGLLNHRAFRARLDEECKRNDRNGGVFAVVMMDLDGFKRLNDTLGHQSGDEALRQVAGYLHSSLRASDILGRYGGDEFVAILPDTDEKAAVALCRQLGDGLGSVHILTQHGQGVLLRLSFGIANYPGDAVRAHTLIGIADHNLYASKQDGGGQITTSCSRVERVLPGPTISRAEQEAAAGGL